MKHAPKFVPTAEMISTACTLFLAKAFTETIRPIVEGYRKKILDDMKPHTSDGRLITEIEFDWTMGDVLFAEYHARCKKERDAAGLTVENDEHCPLLVAEELERRAQHAFLDAMVPVTKMNWVDVLSSRKGIENLNTLLDLSMKLMAPFVDAVNKTSPLMELVGGSK